MSWRITGFSCVSGLDPASTFIGVGLQRQELNQSELSNQVWQDAAKQDVLTELGNRRALIPLLKHEHQRALRTGRAYTLAAVDLDHFKRVNDTFGHAAGDELLKDFASLMLVHCRAIDTVARMGGEEFVILLLECSSQDVVAVLERLRLAQENAHLASGSKTTAVSMGVAGFRGEVLSALEILALVDKSFMRRRRQDVIALLRMSRLQIKKTIRC